LFASKNLLQLVAEWSPISTRFQQARRKLYSDTRHHSTTGKNIRQFSNQRL